MQTQKAKTKLAAMNERIRILEDALRSCRCQGTLDLLSEDLLQVKEGSEEIFESGAGTTDAMDEDETPSRSSTVGTLSVSDGQNLRYYGRSATAVRLFAFSSNAGIR